MRETRREGETLRALVSEDRGPPRRFFVASYSASPADLVPVFEATETVFAPWGAEGSYFSWWRGQSDLGLAVTADGRFLLVGLSDWDGDLDHARFWAGFTPHELEAFDACWNQLLEIVRDPMRFRHPPGWEGFAEDEDEFGKAD